jgi:hypothetical protein
MTTERPDVGGDSGSIVFGWLSRVTLTLALLGLIGFEVLSVAVTHINVEDIGQTTGDRALTAYNDTGDPYLAYVAAAEYAEGQGAELPRKTFQVDEKSVSFELHKTAPTLLLYRWDKSAGLAEVDVTIYAEPFVISDSQP